jgi:hypothetical protein
MNSTILSEITFRRTSNVFLNTGIVALYDYLLEAALEYQNLEVHFSPDMLTLRGEKWYEVLEEIYYRMGREVYDTVTEKQLQNKENVYYLEKDDEFVRFPRIKTYGLTELLTNDIYGTTPNKENQPKISNLRNQRPDLAQKIETYFSENKLELASYVYLNEPYTKITRLEKASSEHFSYGKNICYLTGEGFVKLVDNTSASPFLSGLTNFNSYLSGTDKRISWKAMYLSRFAPKYCFYRYASGLDTIYCYLFEADNLENLRDFIHNNRGIFMDKVQLLAASYMTNFNLPSFTAKKGEEHQLADKNDFSEVHETRFMLIYAIYRQLLFSKNIEAPTELDIDALSEVFGSKNIPVSLVSFKADKFSSTLRPNYFEQFNHFKFTVRLIAHLERLGVNFQSLLQSLVFQHRSVRSKKYNEKIRAARRLRNSVLDKVMKGQSILPEFERLFFWCYLYLNSSDEKDRSEARYKNFRTLSDFLTFYEPVLYKKMEKESLTSLQTRAANLGYAIGNAILEHPDGVKSARRYIIHLHKARNAQDFREALIRIMKKYMNGVANDLLYAEELNDDQRFVFIKQFAVIAALNKINPALKTYTTSSSSSISTQQ